MTFIQTATFFSAAFLLCSCANIDQQVVQTDKDAYQTIANAQIEGLGQAEPFTIERPSETLRNILFRDQELPAHNSSFSLNDANYEQSGRDYFSSAPKASPYVLTILDAIQVGAQNSREYQTRKEAIFRTALALDLEANEFRHSLTGLLGSLFDSDNFEGDRINSLFNNAELSLTQKFMTGMELTTRIGIDLVKLLTQGESSSLGIYGDASILVPLLRGAGRDVVREPLTQAERNVVYEIYGFEQYKADFIVNIIRSYLQVLQAIDQVRNTEENYRKLEEALVRAQRLAEAGRLPEIQVAQAIQDSLRAKDNWLRLSQRYARELDRFKVQLGLPPDAIIRLDSEELRRIAMEGFQDLPGERPISEQDSDQLFLSPDDEQDEFFLQDHYWIAKAMENRLDLRIPEGRVFDVRRKLLVAANDFLPGLYLQLSGAVGGRRPIGTWNLNDAELKFDEGRYGVGLFLDSPFNKTPERIAYRAFLLQLAEEIRNYQRAEDSVKLEVRDELRNLEEFQEQIAIQEKALEVAQWRVDATEMLLRSGRIEIRDLLEARDSLVFASDSLMNAKLNYRLSELDLMKAAGILKVTHQGLFTGPRREASDKSALETIHAHVNNLSEEPML